MSKKSSASAQAEAEMEFLRRRRFHAQSQWPSRTRKSSTGQETASRPNSLPASIQPSLRYSRSTPRLSFRPKAVSPPRKKEDEEWESEEEVVAVQVNAPAVTLRPGRARKVRSMPPAVPGLVLTTDALVQTEPEPEPEPMVMSPMMDEEERQRSRRDMKRLMRTLEPLTGSIHTQAEQLEETRKAVKKLAAAQKELLDRPPPPPPPPPAPMEMAGQDELLDAIRSCSERLQEAAEARPKDRRRLEKSELQRKAGEQESKEQLDDRLMEVRDVLETRVVSNEQFVPFASQIQEQLKEVVETLKDLRRRQDLLSHEVKTGRKDQEKLLKRDDSFQQVATMLEEIHGLQKLQIKHVEDSKPKYLLSPDDDKGRQFLKSHSLPTEDPAIISRIAMMLACIEQDADDDLQANLKLFKDETSNWKKEQVKKVIDGLYKVCLFTDSNNASLVLTDALVGTGDELTPRAEDASQKNAAEFIRGALNFNNNNMVRILLERMNPQRRKQVVNTSLSTKGRSMNSYLLFVSAHTCDLDMFTFLVNCGADLDVQGGQRQMTILHLLGEMSTDPSKGEAVLNMLDVVYTEAGRWWEQKNLPQPSRTTKPPTESTRLLALNYLFSIPNTRRLNALQAAAKTASPNLIKKIITNPPYFTLADPVAFDCDGKKKVYFVSDFESRFCGRESAVLESIVDRQMDMYEMVEMEPFRAMLNDKWDRYKVFYWLWFMLYLLYISTFSACAVGRKVHAVSFDDMLLSTGDQFRFVGEIACLLVLPFFFYGEYCDYTRPQCNWRWCLDVTRMANIVLVFCIVLTTILRWCLSPVEDFFLVIALLLGWVMCTRYVVATRVMGMFPMVIFSVFKEDIIKRFVWIFLILLLGCSTAFYCTFQRLKIDAFPNDSFWLSVLSTFELTFGFLDLDFATNARWAAIGVALMVFYVWLGNILLVNMLIAMVNDTYSSTKSEQARSWMHTKAWHALVMERRLLKSSWIQYNNQNDTVSNDKAWSLANKLRLYTRTQLRYGQKPVSGQTFAGQKTTDYYVIIK